MKKDILILGPSPFNQDINHSGGQLTAITNLIIYIEDKNISYDIIDVFRSSFPPPSITDKIIGSFHTYRKLKNILNNNSYKGALVFGTYGLGYWEKLLFSLLIEKNGIKTLFFIRSGHFMDFVRSKNYNIPIQKFLMNRVSYIGHQGGKWGDCYRKIGVEQSRLVKILNWINIEEYNRTFENKRITFLYVGAIVKKKGVNELLDIILKYQELKEYQFIFIGGGTLLDELIQRVKINGAKNVLFKGWLNEDEVSKYYQKADALILPSYTEGFPNVISEALNYRLPIIATNVGGIAESVIDNHNGFLIEPKDRVKLYKSIKKIGESKELRERFSKNSEKILKENHLIEKNCEKLFNLFNIKYSIRGDNT